MSEKEAKACIEKGRGKNGNFVLCSGCMVPAETPSENIEAMIGSARKYGRY